MPACAMTAANTPLRAAFAAAQPFHIVRWPRRLMSVPRFGTAASAIALAVCGSSGPAPCRRRPRSTPRCTAHSRARACASERRGTDSGAPRSPARCRRSPASCRRRSPARRRGSAAGNRSDVRRRPDKCRCPRCSGSPRVGESCELGQRAMRGADHRRALVPARVATARAMRTGSASKAAIAQPMVSMIRRLQS